MNINLKLFVSLTMCLAITACTTTNQKPQIKESFQWVNVYQLSENITIDSTNPNELNDFKAIQKKANTFSVNTIFKNALDHYLLDTDEFNGDVVANSTIEKSTKSSYLKPLLIPSVKMSRDYRVITVALTATTDQSQRVYSSEKIISNGTLSENKHFIINNPVLLKEMIVSALYEVAEQYAEDSDQANK